MKKKISQIPFSGTPEQEAKLLEVIEQNRDVKGCLMPIMQEAQNIYGYLPVEVQTIIADKLGISIEEVYGVSTFYSMFNLSPKGKYQISVCLGTACYVKGAQQVIDKFSDLLKIKPGETTEDGLFTLDVLRCLGACAIAPAVSVNGKVFPNVKVDNVAEIIKQYRDLEAK